VAAGSAALEDEIAALDDDGGPSIAAPLGEPVAIGIETLRRRLDRAEIRSEGPGGVRKGRV
jgi:hypothetical protein